MLPNGKYLTYGINNVQNGCNFYRITQPIGRAIELEQFEGVLASELKGDEHELFLAKSDVIYSQIGTSESFLEFMAENKGKKKFVLDYDDNIFRVSPFNPSYLQHGTTEVDLHFGDDKIVPIRDGENGFSIEANRKRIDLFCETLTNVDLVTTPSPELATIFKRFNKNVKVIKNLIDFRTWTPLSLIKDDFIRIGWQGGWSHYEDFQSIQTVLETILKEHQNVKLVIMGTHFDGITKNINPDQIETYTWVGMEAYPWKFKSLGIDIGIAPLLDNEFNNCKSELKWAEYGALGIPTIASNVKPYSIAIKPGLGLLASNENEWLKALKTLILSQKIRKDMGEAVKAHIFKHYNLDKEVGAYKASLDELMKKNIILTVV